jgi:enoyl-CoA hydratase/carnithine racemase
VIPNGALLHRGGVEIQQDGPVLYVELNRPDVRNAMRPSTWHALGAVGAWVPEDVRVVVVRGAGAAFSAGLDRRSFAGETVDGEAPLANLMHAERDDFDQVVAGFQEGFRWLRDPRFISIAVVQGFAIGAGFQLALACDIRVSTDDARFCMREPALGLVPDLTGTKHLVEAVGYARALEWCATARFVDAHEAVATGLVSAAVPLPALDAAVADLVNTIAGHPHGAVTATKSLLLAATTNTLGEQLPLERAAQFERFAALRRDT